VFINDACPEDFSLLYDYPQKPLVGALPDWYRDEFPSLESAGGYGRPMPTFQAAGIQKSTVVIVQNNAA
jgi:hypothetical protein